MESVKGYLKAVLFHNEDNNYNVIKIKCDDDKILTVTGYFILPSKDDNVRYYGEYVNHPRFGTQLQVERIEKVLPDDRESVIKYLSSPYFKGVGTIMATKIVDTLGSNAISIIQNHPSVLDDIGISEKAKNSILNGINSENQQDKDISFMLQHGLSQLLVMKIEAVYGDEMVSRVLANPYSLIEDIDGIGFKSADEIARNFNVSLDDPRRIAAAIIYSLNEEAMSSGDTYTNIDTLALRCSAIIPNLSKDAFDDAFRFLIMEGKVVVEDDKIFTYKHNHYEKVIATFLSQYIKRKSNKFDEAEFNTLLHDVEDKEGIFYSEEQIEAIRTGIFSPVTIVTGGPGTGKTTILNAIIKIYKRLYSDHKVVLCAPTGRASKRMSELTGVEACTIHRLLKWDKHTNTFAKNMDDPVYGDLLIIDEFSMVDIHLFANLLMGIRGFGHIIFIGDVDQIPSVGCGNNLEDLLDIDMINKIRLNRIYRQKGNSSIITLAHNIKDKKLFEKDLEPREDLLFVDTTSYDIAAYVKRLYSELLDEGYSEDEIQILAPIYASTGGIDHLNNIIQDMVNPSEIGKVECRIGRTLFRENDKILQLKNQVDDDIYNGDIGRIVEIILKDASNGKLKIIASYDDKLVSYTGEDLKNITLAYAISIHKSQGSEYPVVIMPVIKEYRQMLYKNLIYTGITRAKKRLVMVGEKQALLNGVKLRELKRRNTTLREKLNEILKRREIL